MATYRIVQSIFGAAGRNIRRGMTLSVAIGISGAARRNIRRGMFSVDMSRVGVNKMMFGVASDVGERIRAAMAQRKPTMVIDQSIWSAALLLIILAAL